MDIPQERVFVGIDVGKDRLDAQVLGGERLSVADDPAGLKALAARLKRLGPVAIAVEASGGCEKPALARLTAAGLDVWRLDAGQVKAFARGLGRRAKTGRIDAETVARCLAAVWEKARPWRPDPAAERVEALTAFRRKLVAERTALTGYADRASEPVVARMVRARLAALKLSLVRLEKEIARALAADPALARRNTQLQSAPGVGPVLAATLIAELPGLGRLSSREIAALAGVAPYDRQSGRTTRPGRCQAGRSGIRAALYMGALSGPRPQAAARRVPPAPHGRRQALQACARRRHAQAALVTLNAMLRDDTVWAR